MFEGIDQLVPHGQIGGGRVQSQLVADDGIKPLIVEHLRNLVDGVGIPYGNDGVFTDVGKQGNLGTFVFGNRPVGTAQQRVRVNPDFTQLLDTVLGRFRFQLTCRSDVRNERQMDEYRRVLFRTQAQLACGFQKRQGFDIADGTADFDQRDFVTFRATVNEILDFVGDMRDDLDGFAQIFPTSFLADDGFINLPGGEVVHLVHPGGNETFIMAQIQVGFRAVVGDEDFAVLERTHRAGVHIDIWVQLDHGDFKAARFEDGGKRCGGDTLTQG